MKAACIGCSWSPFAKSFDGGDFAPLQRRGQGQAGQHALSVHQHGACAALALIAALLGACQRKAFAQRVEQHDARVDVQRLRHAVDLERDLHDVLRHDRRRGRAGHGRQLRERGLGRQQVRGEEADATTTGLHHERAARLTHVVQRGHLSQGAPLRRR
jgi:hypothetical protein